MALPRAREAPQAAEHTSLGVLAARPEALYQRGSGHLDNREPPGPAGRVKACAGRLHPLWEGREGFGLLHRDPPQGHLVVLVERYRGLVAFSNALTCCLCEKPQASWHYAGVFTQDHAGALKAPEG